MKPCSIIGGSCRLLTILCLSASVVYSQSAKIVGRVTDEVVDLALGGALVQVLNSEVKSYTDDQGNFVLANVPAGERAIRVSYLGYETTETFVEVPSSGTVRADVAFSSDVVELDAFQVQGALVGTARALNSQRAADSLSNIVASDEIGNFPDQNAAESLQRIPGVALYRDQGEGRYVVLRGLNYTFTSVELDGASFAGADLGERATALDVVSSDMLSSIKVTKVPTPDMDAEGIAGKVNIKTKSPFDGDVYNSQVGLQMTYSDITGDWSHKFNGETSWISDDGNWGFLVAPSFQSREYGSHNYEVADAWSEEDSPSGGEFYFPEEVQFREYEIKRERKGVTATIEARPNDETKLYLRTNYNNFADTENRYRTILPLEDGEITALSAESGTVENVEGVSRRLRQREKDQEVFGVIAGFEKLVGSWTLDGFAGMSKGEETRPNETSTRFERGDGDVSFNYSFTNPYDFTINQTAGPSISEAATYNEFDKLELANESGEEDSLDLALNARYDFAGDRQAYLKFGVRMRTKEKSSEIELIEFEDGPDSFSFANLAGETTSYPFLRAPRIDAAKVNAAFFGNETSFDSERVIEDSTLDDWRSEEDILAVYGMAGWTLGKSSFIAGARFEQTDFETNGFEYLEDSETGSPISATRDYDNFLPSFQYRYNATENLVYRASWSNSLARPGFGDTAYRRFINDDADEMEIGNPNLETLESTNWDASVEYYLPSLGVVSAAVFYKDIENFAFEQSYERSDSPEIFREILGTDPAFESIEEITTFSNGSKGDIKGLELAYQQELALFGDAFKGFGVMANVTFLDSEATYPTREDENVPFIGQSDTVGNLAFTYEKGKFFSRVAMNWRSERLREDEAIGGDVFEDLYVDDFSQIDLTFRYRASDHWTFYTEVLNITDEPFRVFLKSPDGAPARNGQVEEYGWSSNIGFRWHY
ncbi:TonB-dependent receptor [Pelagicoccus sp. SDUM812002]|uniref:TonB-dependent receptor n=1 Tax=Pelagicoccus sp. SDUM812002 TaxID=3041266 RepID=UPI002810717E|nr:TonB-dependent receptor [Pelagicoccus sp. SDUM812002]MDQ8184491.1 TonB-dependent receptor [Pelagicoccus sp. SDUM812002]